MANQLTAIQIKNAGDGKLSDGRGLFLLKKGPAGRWVYRYQFQTRRRDMGLGSYPEMSLAAARKERDRWAAVAAAGRDPIDTRQAEREAADVSAQADDPTFAEAAQRVLESIKSTLKDDGAAGRWISPLTIHMNPKIGRKRMSKIQPLDLANALRPIWRTKHPTAIKAVNRTRITFQRCRRMGIPCHEETVEIALQHLGDHVHHAESIVATEWQRIPEIYAQLEDGGTGAKALQWMILTLVRSGGCRGARFDEIEGDVWTVPAERMKGRKGRTKPFRVPLSDEALRIRDQMAEMHERLLFEGQRPGRPITDVAIEKVMNRLKEPGRPHGFRTSFRTWVQDTDATSYDVAETVLAHTIGNTVERSYARSDLLEKRRVVMQTWADYVTGASSKGNVVPIRSR
ncbi:DUF4102 domain-containing protein [Salipiger sp. IMCC34102]|uniref:tyrosine-type recombinase/integrase n=1 Tax=Salipiger sp. IMCC34102 TaxID=2510647 RepID=UPI00101DDEB6|nr:integrase arm-type DNA-binding domain-containing protein [Salipiger sp. IMCC34102]RYH04144.1 DUF4102 domain-containing protein [Salipiger sp. IMCC34102]